MFFKGDGSQLVGRRTRPARGSASWSASSNVATRRTSSRSSRAFLRRVDPGVQHPDKKTSDPQQPCRGVRRKNLGGAVGGRSFESRQIHDRRHRIGFEQRAAKLFDHFGERLCVGLSRQDEQPNARNDLHVRLGCRD